MGEEAKSDPQPGRPPSPPRDLADFHVRWPQFRALAQSAARAGGLDPAEREVLSWLIRLADRVGPRDLV